MKLWRVGVDIDDEFVCFAECTSEEKAKDAKNLLDKDGTWEDVYIVKDNLKIDEITIDDVTYKL